MLKFQIRRDFILYVLHLVYGIFHTINVCANYECFLPFLSSEDLLVSSDQIELSIVIIVSNISV